VQREVERLKERGPQVDVNDLLYKWGIDRTSLFEQVWIAK